MSELAGLIFDCDGTLADTMPLHWRAWQVISARHGFNFPRDRFYSLGGVPSRDILKILSTEQGLGLDHLAVAREKEAEYLPLIAQVEPINAVVGIVLAARESDPTDIEGHEEPPSRRGWFGPGFGYAVVASPAYRRDAAARL